MIDNIDDMEVYLTETQVQEMTNIPKSTLRLWRSKKKNLPFMKYGKYVRYPKSRVQSYLNNAIIEVA